MEYYVFLRQIFGVNRVEFANHLFNSVCLMKINYDARRKYTMFERNSFKEFMFTNLYLALDPVILKKALFQENGMGRIRAGLTQSLR